ncbi:hypothetical protein KEM52_000393 [Ascosphaera acerosa]|nr:hypothetical protein KEM52_000393 [Ascosphaera acerosa]
MSNELSSAARSRLQGDLHNTEFWVVIKGPKDTPFEGGRWKVHVEVPATYPFKSPSIGFVNKIFHPNIDELSGSVCLDVINQTWSPMYEMLNIFDTFLPHLLRYPNPSDPLNGDAASLLMGDPAKYDAKVKEYVRRYAMPSSSAKPAETEAVEQSASSSSTATPGTASSGATAATGVSTQSAPPPPEAADTDSDDEIDVDDDDDDGYVSSDNEADKK